MTNPDLIFVVKKYLYNLIYDDVLMPLKYFIAKSGRLTVEENAVIFNDILLCFLRALKI